MAELNVVEFRALAMDLNNNFMPVGKQPAVAVQNITFTTGTKSAAFQSSTRFVQLLSDTDADLDFGGADLPAAPTRLQKIKAGVTIYYGVDGNSFLSVKTS